MFFLYECFEVPHDFYRASCQWWFSKSIWCRESMCMCGIGIVAGLEVPSLANVSTCSLSSMSMCAQTF